MNDVYRKLMPEQETIGASHTIPDDDADSGRGGKAIRELDQRADKMLVQLSGNCQAPERPEHNARGGIKSSFPREVERAFSQINKPGQMEMQRRKTSTQRSSERKPTCLS